MTAVTVIPAHNDAAPPEPPRWISEDAEALEQWQVLWGLGQSTLWGDAEVELVARLIELRSAFHRQRRDGDAIARLCVQLNRLESALLLSPAARRTAGIVIESVPVLPDDGMAARKAEMRKRLSAIEGGNN